MHIYAYAYTSMHIYAYTRALAYIYAYAHASMHIHAYTRVLVYIYTRIHTRSVYTQNLKLDKTLDTVTPLCVIQHTVCIVQQ